MWTQKVYDNIQKNNVIPMKCVKLEYIEIISIQDILILNNNLQKIASFQLLKVDFTFKTLTWSF